MPKIIHISPAYFSEQGVIGGGERFPLELARAMADRVPTELLTFGPAPRRFAAGRCPVRILSTLPSPWGGSLARLNFGFARLLRSADVIHVHQFRCPIGQWAIVIGRALRKKVGITDLGGRVRGPFGRPGAAKLAHVMVAVSSYSAAQWSALSLPTHVVYAGVDDELLQQPIGGDGLLIVGRILPHKCIDVAIEALPQGQHLTVLGRPYDGPYLQLLRRLAIGKDVRFLTSADDDQLKQALLAHRVLVMASSDLDHLGSRYEMPELLGIAILEGMAAGKAVVVSDLPPFLEVVQHGVTGLVFRRNDAADLAAKLRVLSTDPKLAASLGAAARSMVRERFTWTEVVERCLAAYGE